MFETKVIEKIKTNILFSVTFFFENLVVYEKNVGKKIVARGRLQMAVWLMRITCWITKATNTHTQVVVILNTFPQQQRLHERASMLRYTCIVCLVCSSFNHLKL